MSLRPHIIIIGTSAALSAAVQSEFFKRGVKWNGGSNGVKDWPTKYNQNAALRCDGKEIVHAEAEVYELNSTFCDLPRFDAATQFGAWLAFLDEPEKSLGQVAYEAKLDAEKALPWATDTEWSELRKDSQDVCEKIAQAVIEAHEKRKAAKA